MRRLSQKLYDADAMQIAAGVTLAANSLSQENEKLIKEHGATIAQALAAGSFIESAANTSGVHIVGSLIDGDRDNHRVVDIEVPGKDAFVRVDLATGEAFSLGSLAAIQAGYAARLNPKRE